MNPWHYVLVHNCLSIMIYVLLLRYGYSLSDLPHATVILNFLIKMVMFLKLFDKMLNFFVWKFHIRLSVLWYA